MAPSREERFLIRQRGAGARQLKDFDFNFDLSEASRAPLKPVKSGRSRRTPQPALQPQRSSRKTPNSLPKTPRQPPSKTPATRRSARSGKVPSGNAQVTSDPDAGPSLQSTRRDEMGVTTKRRKLSDVTELLEQKREDGEGHLADLPANEEPTNTGGSVEETGNGDQKAAGGDGEEAEKKRKRKKRKSIVQGVKKRPSLITSKVIPKHTEHSAEILSDPVEEPSQKDDDVPYSANATEAVPTSSHMQPMRTQRKRKKRKSIGQQARPRRKSVAANHISSVQQQPPSDSGRLQVPSPSIGQSRSDYEVSSPETQANALKVEDEQDGLLIADYQSDHEPTPTHAVQSARPTKQTTQRSAPIPEGPKKTATKVRVRKTTGPTTSIVAQRSPKARSREVRGAIPITVHRLSRLPVSDEEDDPPASANPIPKKAGFTAADVLSQLCEEVFTQTIESLGRASNRDRDGKAREDRKRKREVIEAYQDEVNGRLFQISEALDYSHTLKTRVRRAKKEKVTLVEELLSLRNQRDEVALKTDEVRLNHVEASKAAQEDNEIATLIQDIELAVQRGRALQSDFVGDAADVPKDAMDLEFSLQKVAAEVSSAAGPGLLNQVKDFNLFLEKAITAV